MLDANSDGGKNGSRKRKAIPATDRQTEGDGSIDTRSDRAECHPHPGDELVKRKINFSPDLLLPSSFSPLSPLPWAALPNALASNIPRPQVHQPKNTHVRVGSKRIRTWMTRTSTSSFGKCTQPIGRITLCSCQLHVQRGEESPCESSIIGQEEGGRAHKDQTSSFPPKSF